MSPCVAVRHLDTPAERFRVLNRLFNVFVGMTGSAHSGMLARLLTHVKRSLVYALRPGRGFAWADPLNGLRFSNS